MHSMDSILIIKIEFYSAGIVYTSPIFFSQNYAILYSRYTPNSIIRDFDRSIIKSIENGQVAHEIEASKRYTFDIPRMEDPKITRQCIETNSISSLDHGAYKNIRFENVKLFLRLNFLFFLVLFFTMIFHFFYELVQ